MPHHGFGLLGLFDRRLINTSINGSLSKLWTIYTASSLHLYPIFLTTIIYVQFVQKWNDPTNLLISDPEKYWIWHIRMTPNLQHWFHVQTSNDYTVHICTRGSKNFHLQKQKMTISLLVFMKHDTATWSLPTNIFSHCPVLDAQKRIKRSLPFIFDLHTIH